MSDAWRANDETKLLDAVPLTAAYGGNTTISYEYRSGLGLTFLVNYTPNAGSATAYVEFQVEMSYDAATWIPYGEWTRPAVGTREGEQTTFKVNQTYPKMLLTLDELRGRYFRLKARETSVTASNFGTLSIYSYTHAL